MYKADSFASYPEALCVPSPSNPFYTPRSDHCLALKDSLVLPSVVGKTYLCFVAVNPHLRVFCPLILERVGGERGEREKLPCERDASIGCLPCAPQPGLGNQTCASSVCRPLL